MSKVIQHLQSINKNDEWGTPKNILDAAAKKFNINPIIDVCATSENAKLMSYLVKEIDGLTCPWDESFFMNPPYSQITTWMEKAYTEHLTNNVDALILVYAKTDTKWWHKYVEGIAEIHFIKGRLKFIKPDGTISKNSAPYPSCWIIYRRKEN